MKRQTIITAVNNIN